jgi:hypothetical protein
MVAVEAILVSYQIKKLITSEVVVTVEAILFLIK